ncbi:Response regulator receiver domain-containing protein [Nitrosospira multiformis]|uniref:Response regulator receiver domain-containing protein n=1 Tax=Nitrosospira multiformis TaxID=1231 RepID=A0A1H8NMX9_9PROT|nr:response regulator [Nitrosospira multiformis]SEO31091.1 Response regulator receiver domain-containing protein [Nitrosospira multiformis]
MKVTHKPILLVEDDQVFTMAVTRAFRELQVPNQIVYRENGEEALNFLGDENGDRPCIILLDLDMPIMNGIEFLQAVKKDERLRPIPVVVMTTSDDQQDKVNSFDLGVAGYMPKPLGYGQFVQVMRSIDTYWTISEMP